MKQVEFARRRNRFYFPIILPEITQLCENKK